MSLRQAVGVFSIIAVALVLAACTSSVEDSAEFRPMSTTVSLEPTWAGRGDSVTVKLTGANSQGAQVEVAGVPAAVTIINSNSFSFVVPEEVDTGRQQVVIALSRQTLLTELGVLGEDTVSGEFMLVVPPGTTATELDEMLDGLEWSLLEGPRPLGGSEGVCAGELVRITVGGVTSALAPGVLDSLVAAGTVWYADPQSGYSAGAIDHLSAVGARSSRLRGATGAGTLLAVLDTGVSAHSELGSRLLLGAGYDFVDEDASAVDDYGPTGHGTPIAVLAAGSSSGVAPAAQVLPVRVCDEGGTCYTSDVLLGMCHAFVAAQGRPEGMGNLVVNLSLGGATPNTAIQAAVDYGLGKGILFAASAGNQGENGSPRHYPAAYDLEGVVVTGALETTVLGELLGDWRPAAFSTRGDYLDIAAPGVDVSSGSSDGGYESYSGTSFATGLVSGALAAWRGAEPGLTPAQIEAGLKAAAKPMSYPRTEVGAGMLDLSSQPD